MGYVTLDTLAVVRYVAKALGPVYGREVIDDLGIKSGVVYPILRRLDVNGLLTSEWEKTKPKKRPRRRYYEITTDGLDWLDEAQKKYP